MIGRVVSFVILWTLLGAGCGGSERPELPRSGQQVGSVCVQEAGFCADLSGTAFDESDVRSYCSMVGGALAEGSCPGADRAGHCLLNFGEPGEIALSYYRPAYDSSSSKAECNGAGGLWLP